MKIHNKDVLMANFDIALTQYSNNIMPLHGIRTFDKKNTFISQLIESVRRVNYVGIIASRDISTLRADPASSLFDPIRAAIFYLQNGNIEEASWLVFLSVHFGKASTSGWDLVSAFYGGLNQGFRWDWIRVSQTSAHEIDAWVSTNWSKLRAGKKKFGNHRKYESLHNLGTVIESYVNWVSLSKDHANLFKQALKNTNQNSMLAFDYLYRNMKVKQFGRTAKFDYLTMIGKTRICNIVPDKAYLTGATGPMVGAKLFFGVNLSAKEFEKHLLTLGKYLNVGMQELEDSLCNWQKSPSVFVRYRG